LPVGNCISFWVYLNDNAGAIQAVSTVVLVIITAIYVWLTKQLSDASDSQLRFQKKSEEYRIQQEIIDGSLKFVFRIKDDSDKLSMKKFKYLMSKRNYPDKAKELEKKFFEDVNSIILDRQFFPELMYFSFQLKRLKEKELWKDLEQMGDIYEKMIHILTSCEDIDEYETINAEFLTHEKDFVIKCLDISKVDSE